MNYLHLYRIDSDMTWLSTPMVLRNVRHDPQKSDAGSPYGARVGTGVLGTVVSRGLL